MEQYLIDNNVVSNYFSELFSENGMNFIGNVFDETPIISVITEIEALSWINPDKTKEEIIREFVNDSLVLGLTQPIINKCIAIRRNKKNKTPDAIIAATAIVHKLTLISSDAGFENIQDLNIINSFNIF